MTTVHCYSQIQGKILQNFVAFSEYMNFIIGNIRKEKILNSKESALYIRVLPKATIHKNRNAKKVTMYLHSYVRYYQ